MPQAELVFVNKTAKSKSLSRSVGRERTKIFSHVQRGPDGSRSKTLTVPRSSRAVSRSESPQDQESVPWRPTNSTRPPEQSSSSKAIESQIRSITTHCLTKAPQGSWTGGGLPGERGFWNVKDLPPFLRGYGVYLDKHDDNTQLQLSPVDRILTLDDIANAYLRAYFDTTEQACEVFSSNSEISETFAYTVKQGKTDLALRIALACTVASSLSVITKNEQHTSFSFHFKKLALGHLRGQLCKKTSSAVPVSTVLAITLLLWVECVEGNFDHASAHISALELMLSHYTTIQSIPLVLANTAYDFPYLCSAMMRTRPIPLPDVARNNILPQPLINKLEKLAREKEPSVGSRFFVAPASDALGPELLDLIRRMRFCRLFRAFCKDKSLEPNQTEVNAMAMENIRISHALLMMPFNSTSTTPLTPMQNAVRLAVFVTFQTIVSIMGSSTAFCRSMYLQLRAAIDQSDPRTMWAPNMELLMWVLGVAANSSNTQEKWVWAARRMNFLISLAGIETVDALGDVMEGFFVARSRDRHTLESIWRAREVGDGDRSPLEVFEFRMP